MSKRKSWVRVGAIAVIAICAAAPAFAQSARPYDLAQLSADARTAVENARDAQRRALRAAARAEGAGGAGLVHFTGTGGDTYAGECAPCNPDPQRHGYGLMSWTDGEIYAGAHARGADGGMKHGYGVYIFANGEIFEGQISADQFNGYGVTWDANGAITYQGRYLNGQPSP